MKTKIELTDEKLAKAYTKALDKLMCDDDLDAENKLTVFLVSTILIKELRTA